MDNLVANTQLELACRLGLLDDVIEALDEDGADVNCNGCSPIFFAMEAGDRPVVEALLERGAEVAMFGVDRESEDAVELLLGICSQGDAEPKSDTDGMAELDAKMIRAFDRMVRTKGFAEPIKKKRTAEYQAFCDGLGSLAAEDCQALVKEFLEWAKPEEEAEAIEFVGAEENAEKLADLDERYAKVTSEELPGELLKDYLKEMKKVK